MTDRPENGSVVSNASCAFCGSSEPTCIASSEEDACQYACDSCCAHYDEGGAHAMLNDPEGVLQLINRDRHRMERLNEHFDEGVGYQAEQDLRALRGLQTEIHRKIFAVSDRTPTEMLELFGARAVIERAIELLNADRGPDPRDVIPGAPLAWGSIGAAPGERAQAGWLELQALPGQDGWYASVRARPEAREISEDKPYASASDAKERAAEIAAELFGPFLPSALGLERKRIADLLRARQKEHSEALAKLGNKDGERAHHSALASGTAYAECSAILTMIDPDYPEHDEVQQALDAPKAREAAGRLDKLCRGIAGLTVYGVGVGANGLLVYCSAKKGAHASVPTVFDGFGVECILGPIAGGV